MQLKEKSCVITGAGRGLGKCLAKEMSKRGAKLTLGDLDNISLEQTVKELSACYGFSCDVTNQNSVAELAKSAMDKFNQIDVWINNAGVWMPYGPAEELNFTRAHALMEVNFFGLAHGVVEAMKIMKKQKKGIIVNIISVRGLEGKPFAAAYSASKFAAEGFTQAIRGELTGFDISILNVYPHRMKTELFGENKHEDYEISMEPEDVAKIIVENIELEKPFEHLEIWSVTDIRRK